MTSASTICPVCNDRVEKLVYRYHFESEQAVLHQIRKVHPQWASNDGICSRCIDHYQSEIVLQQRILPEIGPHFPVRTVDDFVVLPIGIRLNAHPKYTGKGVTICFIDSGFCEHPDLTAFRNRIKAVVDIATGSTISGFNRPHHESWHGTMTSVVCAGDGYLSRGLYKGLASQSELVLLKVMNEKGEITSDNVANALRWVKANHRKYGIRVVNVSLGVAPPPSNEHNEVNSLAEELVREGIIIVAAVGNDTHASVHPPADSSVVISVGGLNDNNRIDEPCNLYHSSFGTTTESITKPDVIAPAIWIASPILPETEEQAEAQILFDCIHLDGDELRLFLGTHIQQTKLPREILSCRSIDKIKDAVVARIQQCKYISPHYMHVEGTSFAAPIVTSIIAQLLEKDPALGPREIRQVLCSSATRLPHYPVIRQGFGAVDPRRALLKVLSKAEALIPISPHFDRDRHVIELYIQNQCAEEIVLAGSFNNWDRQQLLMEPCEGGIWKFELPMLPNGTYEYKFLIDQRMWMEDVDNPFRRPDGFTGFNSVLFVNN
jgi:serine protease AprX